VIRDARERHAGERAREPPVAAGAPGADAVCAHRRRGERSGGNREARLREHPAGEHGRLGERHRRRVAARELQHGREVRHGTAGAAGRLGDRDKVQLRFFDDAPQGG